MEPKTNVDGIAVRLVDSLLSQPNLDSVQSFFVSNSICDDCPEWQRAMLKLIGTERERRDGEPITEVELPDLDMWPVETLLLAGKSIMCCGEVAAQSGNPMLMDFGFRLMQFWFIGVVKAACERML